MKYEEIVVFCDRNEPNKNKVGQNILKWARAIFLVVFFVVVSVLTIAVYSKTKLWCEYTQRILI